MKHEDRIKLALFFANTELSNRFGSFQKKIESMDVDNVEYFSDLLRDIAQLFDDEMSYIREKAAEFDGLTMKELDNYGR